MKSLILVLNAGSSSIKFALFTAATPCLPGLRGMISGLGSKPVFSVQDSPGALPAAKMPLKDTLTHAAALEWLIAWLREQQGGELAGAGHRVVHGGEHFTQPTLIDTAAFSSLEKLISLAPLHQPHNLAAIRTLMTLQPGLPQVACFDTAFHNTQDTLAQSLALPRELTAGGVKRYGFHGLSYEYIAGALPQVLGARADGHIIVAHLGNGASLCALQRRKSIATTMGFSTLDGLMSGTRCGSIDPGVLFYLMRERKLSPEQLEDRLYRESGLLGVSGESGDMRELLASTSPSAKQAVALFCYRAVREIGSLVAALGGLDALVFTAGIGERSHEVRARICEQLAWLGLNIEIAANRAHETTISARQSRVTICVIPTNEEAVIARHTARLLQIK